jgi:hypothetical protein
MASNEKKTKGKGKEHWSNVPIEVPERTRLAVSDVMPTEVMLAPGAYTSTQVPKLDHDGAPSVMFEAPTVRASGTRALGQTLCVSGGREITKRAR